MAQRSLKPYREAQLTPCMKTVLIVGAIVFTIICFIVMQVPSLAQWLNWWLEVGTINFKGENMEDISYFGIRGMRNNKYYASLPRAKKYKLMSETYEGGLITEYFIIGSDGVWCEGYTTPKGAIAEALAVIPGISVDDIEISKN